MEDRHPFSPHPFIHKMQNVEFVEEDERARTLKPIPCSQATEREAVLLYNANCETQEGKALKKNKTREAYSGT